MVDQIPLKSFSNRTKPVKMPKIKKEMGLTTSQPFSGLDWATQVNSSMLLVKVEASRYLKVVPCSLAQEEDPKLPQGRIKWFTKELLKATLR